MSALTIIPSRKVIGLGIPTPFTGAGGTAPYAFSVAIGGCGGTINASTGLYTAPQQISTDPAKATDIVIITDSVGKKNQAVVRAGNALQLLCDIIQTELSLADGRVYMWDQKLQEPTDFGLYIAVSILGCKPFANNRNPVDPDASQYTCFQATLGIDIISRDSEARDRKEEVIMALNSYYSESQQEANSFKIASLPMGFVNLSNVDGAAIPYRFHITANMLYSVTKVSNAPYFNDFSAVDVLIDEEDV